MTPDGSDAARSTLPAVTPLNLPAPHPIVLFGGSFDPPHAGHVSAAARARDELFGSDGWLLLVPAARSPHKATGPVASDAQRIRMLEIAFEGVPRVSIWTDEIGRGGDAAAPSFTIDTVRRLRTRVPTTTPVRLLIGADQAVAFDRWRESEELERLAEPAVAPRAPFRVWEDLARAGLDAERWGPRLLGTPLVDAASTEVRSGTVADVSPAVRRYIEAEGLYSRP